MVALEEIRDIFRGRILVGESLAKYTTFRIGGPADFYLEPHDRDDLIAIVRFFKQKEYPWFIIGRGSNLLVSDEGFRGAVINLERALSSITLEDELVIAEAGVRIGRFVEYCIRQRRAGVEMLAGIPGTVGGAVVMNAGAYGGEISGYLDTIEVFRDDRIHIVRKEKGLFSYRKSPFGSDIVLSASFHLPVGDTADLLRRRRQYLIKRNETHPLNLHNAGSTFKNPPGQHAWELIDHSGLRGKKIGGAQISERHANYIINRDQASATDVLALIKLVQQRVQHDHGVILEPEVKFIGFLPGQMKLLAGV